MKVFFCFMGELLLQINTQDVIEQFDWQFNPGGIGDAVIDGIAQSAGCQFEIRTDSRGGRNHTYKPLFMLILFDQHLIPLYIMPFNDFVCTIGEKLHHLAALLPLLFSIFAVSFSFSYKKGKIMTNFRKRFLFIFLG